MPTPESPLGRRNAVRTRTRPPALEAAKMNIDLMALTGTGAEDFRECPYCLYQPTGRDTKNRRSHMKRHMETHGSERLPCNFPGCTKSFAGRRKDNLRMHLVKVHKMDRATITSDSLTAVATPVRSPFSAGELLTNDWADHMQGGGPSLEPWSKHESPGSGEVLSDQIDIDDISGDLGAGLGFLREAGDLVTIDAGEDSPRATYVRPSDLSNANAPW